MANYILGVTSSIRGKLAAFWNKASADIPIPGAITPPKNHLYHLLHQK